MGMRLAARRGDERGAVMILATVGVVLAVMATALSVDIGRIAQERRRNQKVADMAALDAVRILSLTPADPDVAAQAAAHDSFVRNFFPERPGFSVLADAGTVDAAGSFDPTGSPPTAVKVQVVSLLSNDFAPGERSITARATATLGNGSGCTLPDLCVRNDGNPIGTVRVGSSVASVDSTQSVILNRLLTNVLGGGTFNLDAVGWQGLANGNVQFEKLQAALGYSALSTDELADASFKFRTLLDATASALNQSGESSANLTAAGKVLQVAGQVTATAGADIRFGELFEVVGSAGSGNDVADARINALDVVRGGLILADSDHFAELTLLASDLPLIPDLVDVKVKFGLIEAPQMKSGPPKEPVTGTYRTVATTSQVRMLVEVKLNLDLGLVARVNVTIPYYIDAGTAQGKLDTISCTVGQSRPNSVTIVGVTQAASANIGSVSNAALSNPSTAPSAGVATLADVNVTPLIKVRIRTTAATSVSVPGRTATLTFNPPYAFDSPSQPIPGTQLVSLPLLGGSTTTTEVLVTLPLVGEILDVGLSLGVETTLINTLVSRSTGLLNNLITPAMRAMGLSLAGADVWAPPPQECQPTSFNVIDDDTGFNPVPALIE